MQHLRKAPLAHKSQAEELEEILRLDELQADFLRHELFASAKQNVPDGQNDPVIAVVLAAERRMMDPVEGRRDHDVGQPFLARER